MKCPFRIVLCQRLNDPDREAVLGLFEIKNYFALAAAVFLLPMKHLFDVWVLDDGDSLVKIEKPLNNLGYGIKVDVPAGIPQERRVKPRLLSRAVAVILASPRSFFFSQP